MHMSLWLYTRIKTIIGGRTLKSVCYNCNERTVIPNCHGICEKYLEERRQLDIANERKKEARRHSDACHDMREKRLRSKSSNTVVKNHKKQV